MSGMVRGVDEKGVSLVETIFVVTLLGILGSAAVFHGSSIYKNALLNYETVMLASDLKLTQQIDRTAAYNSSNFNMKEKPPAYVEIMLLDKSYYIRVPGNWIKIIRKHYFASDIAALTTNISILSFMSNGDTRFRHMGNVMLYCRKCVDLARKIIIDTTGRIRVDRNKS